MKVTAILPDELVKDVRKFAKGKTLTDSLRKALEEWIYREKVGRLIEHTRQHPLRFRQGFTAVKARELNRRQRW